MTRSDFLDGLRKALNGQVSPAVISENLEYYRSYIASEQQKGRNEQEILDELGDPRLIARSIIAAGETASGRGYNSYGRDPGENYSPDDPNDFLHEEKRNGSFHLFHANKWVVLGIFFLILFLIFSILFFVFKTAFSLLFSFHGLWFWVIVLILIGYLSRRR